MLIGLRLYPELEHFPIEVRSRVLRECRRNCITKWEPWKYSVAAWLAVTPSAWLALRRLPVLVSLRIPLAVSIFLIVLCAVVATVLVHGCYFVFDKHWRIRLLLRHRLIESGVPICVSCGYLLTGLTETRRPECGNDLYRHLKSRYCGKSDTNRPWQKGTGTSRDAVLDSASSIQLGASALLPQAPRVQGSNQENAS